MARPPRPGGWLTADQARERLGISLRTLYKLIDSGQLPAYKMGRVIRLQGADVEAFVESVKIPPGSLRHLFPHRSYEANG